MLTLTREVGEKIVIGDDVVVTVISVSENGRVRLGIEAPRQIRIDRAEVLERIRRENLEAGEPVGPPRLCGLCGPPGEREVGVKERGRRRTLTAWGRRPPRPPCGRKEGSL